MSLWDYLFVTDGLYFVFVIVCLLLIMHHTPSRMKGMLRSWPMSSGIPTSKSLCTSLKNSTKKRKVKMLVRQ